MAGKESGKATANPAKPSQGRTVPKGRTGLRAKAAEAVRGSSASRSEVTAIVLRIAADRSTEFEAMFEAEEIPIWEDFTRRGRFSEARLVRAAGGSEERSGIQDYLLHIVAADHDAHEEHDSDPRFRAFLAKAEKLQPEPLLVWFGKAIFERRS